MFDLTPHTPSVRAQLVARRTYQRPLDVDGTVFETWEQTVARVISHQQWLWVRARDGRPLETPQLEELEKLRYLILNRAAFMSGRTMWLGGTEVARRREASMVNCFGRETTFITSEGVRSFEDFEDGDSVCVQDHLGAWKNAVVKSFGKQALYDIEFRRGRSSQKVRATRDHTWVLASGERTNSLTVGDCIHRPADPMNSWDFYSSNPLERLYWCYGFTFGDGSTLPDAQGVHRWSSVRLCSAKSQFADRFSDMGFSTSQPLSCKGDFVAHTGTYLKTLPDISVDGVGMVRAFVRGYLDADGAKSKNAHRGTGNLFSTIQVTGSETIKWVRRNFPAVGVYITSEATPPMMTNYGERSGETVTFRLCTSFGSAANGTYSVHSVTPSSEEIVWCLQVEDTHSFTLPNGITTGNCSFLRVETVYDVVDAFWLLLQGAGVGFEPVVGSLNGFAQPLTVHAIRSARALGDGSVGREENQESVEDGVWHIRIGDSAEAWAKAVGKILAGKKKARALVLDFSAIRAAGSRLGGYGWISSGDGPLCEAMLKMCDLLNRRVDQLLTRIDILDLMNLLGTTLSSRRSAQIALMPAGDPEADEFAMAKKDCFTNGKSHRGQSNNSVYFTEKPSVAALRGLFATMVDAGGSEPGFINMASARVRAPWVQGFNPCAEQLLANKGVCNLSELVLSRFASVSAAGAAIEILARANYRQTCINLDDGILQRSWHEVNDHLHLCGVGLTGISQWLAGARDPAGDLEYLREMAQSAAREMADELGLARPKHICTTKPSGTLSKVADCSEGVHDALGEFIINTIMLSAHDPLVGQLQAANYRVRPHPQLQESMLVEVPIHFPGASGVPMSAIQQLRRYSLMMQNYVDSNCSITVSYGQDEVRDICAWLYANWDLYVGVSFMPRIDATKTAEELGYSYLPQAVITRDAYETYASTLLPVDLDSVAGNDLLGDDCAGGVCPVR